MSKMDETIRGGWKNSLGKDIVLWNNVLGYKIPKIIAISGKIGSGKDTLADLLKNYLEDYCFGQYTKQLKFADALKQATAAMTGTTVEENYTDQGKAKYIPEFDMTLGKFQQVFGTLAKEHIHPDIWIFPVIKQCINSEDKTSIFLISDCRFVKEAEAIQRAGGVVIRLNRDPNLIPAELKAGRDLSHISETDLDNYNFDFTYQNNGSLKDLEKVVFKFVGFKG